MRKNSFPRLDDVVKRHEDNPIIEAKDVPWPVDSIFNAGAIKHGDKYFLLARVQNLETISELVIAESEDGVNFKVRDSSSIFPKKDIEVDSKGIEDPRITKIDGEYLIVHTSYSRYGPCVGLTTTKDFESFERKGPIIHTGTKNPVLHPERVNGEFLLFHRPMVDENVWASYSTDLRYWRTGTEPVLPPVDSGRKNWYETRIGLGTVPIKTKEGWLHIIHGVQGTNVYRLGVALFELDEPTKLRSISQISILSPQEGYERSGNVPMVVFTCGSIPEEDGTVKIYYGGADTCLCLATAKIDDLVDIALNK